jgi:hypothetical protein
MGSPRKCEPPTHQKVSRTSTIPNCEILRLSQIQISLTLPRHRLGETRPSSRIQPFRETRMSARPRLFSQDYDCDWVGYNCFLRDAEQSFAQSGSESCRFRDLQAAVRPHVAEEVGQRDQEENSVVCGAP